MGFWGKAMAVLPKDRLLALQAQIEQQRNTVESLKHEGHECPDAERLLQQMGQPPRLTRGL